MMQRKGRVRKVWRVARQDEGDGTRDEGDDARRGYYIGPFAGAPCGQPVMVLVLDTLMTCLAREVTGRPRQPTRLSGKDRCQIRQTSPSTEPYLGDTHRPSSRILHITLELLLSTLSKTAAPSAASGKLGCSTIAVVSPAQRSASEGEPPHMVRDNIFRALRIKVEHHNATAASAHYAVSRDDSACTIYDGIYSQIVLRSVDALEATYTCPRGLPRSQEALLECILEDTDARNLPIFLSQQKDGVRSSRRNTRPGPTNLEKVKSCQPASCTLRRTCTTIPRPSRTCSMWQSFEPRSNLNRSLRGKDRPVDRTLNRGAHGRL